MRRGKTSKEQRKRSAIAAMRPLGSRVDTWWASLMRSETQLQNQKRTAKRQECQREANERLLRALITALLCTVKLGLIKCCGSTPAVEVGRCDRGQNQDAATEVRRRPAEYDERGEDRSREGSFARFAAQNGAKTF